MNYINISQKLIDFGFSENDWVFYTYAIMVSGGYLKKFSSILYSSSDNIPRIPIHSQYDVLQKIISIGKQIAACEDNARWNFSEDDLFKKNISLFTKELYLDSYKISGGEIFLFTKNNSSSEITLKVCPDILNLKISGYDVVATWLKFHSHQYTRTTFLDADFAEFLNFLCAIKTQLFLISKLDLFLEKELNSPENWLN